MPFICGACCIWPSVQALQFPVCFQGWRGAGNCVKGELCAATGRWRPTAMDASVQEETRNRALVCDVSERPEVLLLRWPAPA